MHHCLAIQEIVRLIVGNLHEAYKSSVLALACTCRAFENPALDHLWYQQTSLKTLFKCLPEDVWKETAAKVRKYKYYPMMVDAIFLVSSSVICSRFV